MRRVATMPRILMREANTLACPAARPVPEDPDRKRVCFLHGPTGVSNPLGPTKKTQPPAIDVPSVLGHYWLQERIGTGGFGEPEPLSELADVPLELEALVRRTLAKDPKARPQSADAFRAELGRLRNHPGRKPVWN